MNTYLVTEIDWDTDGEPHTLPSSITFASPRQKGLLNFNDEEIVSDYLSDRYGFCVKSFKFIVINWHSDPADEGWDWDSPEERLNDPLKEIKWVSKK